MTKLCLTMNGRYARSPQARGQAVRTRVDVASSGPRTRLATGEDVLIYVERAWVDYWSGLVSLKKKIGHRVLKRQMEHLLQEHGICGR